MRKRSEKPKKNPWKDALYGVYEGPRGNPSEWKDAFRHAFTPEEVEQIVGSDSPWAILGIKPGASEIEIKRAWRQKALQFHPDRHPPDKKEEMTKQFIRCKAAYTKLGGKA